MTAPYIGEEVYHLFMFADYYPCGGVTDFVKSSNSIQELITYYEGLEYKDGNAHIADSSMRIVAFVADPSYKAREEADGNWRMGSPKDTDPHGRSSILE